MWRRAWSLCLSLALHALVEILVGFDVLQVRNDGSDRRHDVGLGAGTGGVVEDRGEAVAEGGVGARGEMADGKQPRHANLVRRFALANKLLVGFFAAGIERCQQQWPAFLAA